MPRKAVLWVLWLAAVAAATGCESPRRTRLVVRVAYTPVAATVHVEADVEHAPPQETAGAGAGRLR